MKSTLPPLEEGVATSTEFQPQEMSVVNSSDGVGSVSVSAAAEDPGARQSLLDEGGVDDDGITEDGSEDRADCLSRETRELADPRRRGGRDQHNWVCVYASPCDVHGH